MVRDDIDAQKANAQNTAQSARDNLQLYNMAKDRFASEREREAFSNAAALQAVKAELEKQISDNRSRVDQAKAQEMLFAFDQDLQNSLMALYEARADTVAETQGYDPRKMIGGGGGMRVNPMFAAIDKLPKQVQAQVLADMGYADPEDKRNYIPLWHGNAIGRPEDAQKAREASAKYRKIYSIIGRLNTIADDPNKLVNPKLKAQAAFELNQLVPMIARSVSNEALMEADMQRWLKAIKDPSHFFTMTDRKKGLEYIEKAVRENEMVDRAAYGLPVR
jgi:hypothetical protein